MSKLGKLAGIAMLATGNPAGLAMLAQGGSSANSNQVQQTMQPNPNQNLLDDTMKRNVASGVDNGMIPTGV